MKIEKLLEKVKAGDTDALNIIYERYSGSPDKLGGLSI